MAAAEVTNVDLTKWSEPIDKALEDGTPCLLATADKDGNVDIAFKGSMLVYDKDHLAWWERSLAEQLGQYEQNPHAVVLYRNPAKYQIPHMRLYGDVILHRSGETRDKIMSRVVQRELDQDPDRKGFGVLLRVNRVRVGRNVVQTRK